VNCFACSHFCNDPAAIERTLPGLMILSSAHASVRGRDGLCLLHDVVTNGARACAQFSAADPAQVAA
jgi:hypothetical protein